MKLQIGETLYELEYTINSVCSLEEVTGKELGDCMKQGGYRGIRTLLWCGMLENTPTLTLKKAGNLLQEYLKDKELGDLVQTIGDAIEQADFLKAQGLLKKK